MNSITFISTSRSDFSAIKPILEYSHFPSYIETNLICFRGVGDIDNLRNVNIKQLKTSIQIDDSNRLDIENEINNIFMELEKDLKNTILFVVGDRWETLFIAYKSIILKIPIIHHSGGDITNGAIDNQIRDAITSLSDFHFTSHVSHTERLIRMGEDKNKIFTVGEPSLIQLNKIINEDKSKNLIPTDSAENYALVCFHSSTLDKLSYEEQAKSILEILKVIPYKLIITYPNMDQGGLIIHNAIQEFAILNRNNVRYIRNLGIHYHKYLINCEFLIGNSSSGILENGFARRIAINVGDRQHGRLKGPFTLDVSYSSKDVLKIINELPQINERLLKNETLSPYFNKSCIGLIETNILNIIQKKKISKVKRKEFKLL